MRKGPPYLSSDREVRSKFVVRLRQILLSAMTTGKKPLPEAEKLVSRWEDFRT
jgi:hypothetical protein